MLASSLLALVLYLGVLAPLSFIGSDLPSPDPEDLHVVQLFSLHWIFAGALLAWYALGYLPHGEGRTTLARQFGLQAPRVARELAIGAVAGVGIWVVVMLILALLAVLVALFGGLESLGEPPPMVLWIAGLSVWTRVAVSLSAGLFEEAFFRGFLQPRVGIGLSTVFFTLAHLSYDQPFMLVGITLLSLLFSWLVIWRQSIWAAVAAHAVFDITQLVVVIPVASGALESQGGLGAIAVGLL